MRLLLYVAIVHYQIIYAYLDYLNKGFLQITYSPDQKYSIFKVISPPICVQSNFKSLPQSCKNFENMNLKKVLLENESIKFQDVSGSRKNRTI